MFDCHVSWEENKKGKETSFRNSYFMIKDNLQFWIPCLKFVELALKFKV